RRSWFAVRGSPFERRMGTPNVERRTSNDYDRRMPPTTPYTADLDNREPISAMRETAARIRALVGDWRPDQFDRSYAPGKWDARQILTHLAHSEVALGYRARMALTTPGYTAQSFDQDTWMAIEAGRAGKAGKAGRLSGHDALDAFLGLAAM